MGKAKTHWRDYQLAWDHLEVFPEELEDWASLLKPLSQDPTPEQVTDGRIHIVSSLPKKRFGAQHTRLGADDNVSRSHQIRFPRGPVLQFHQP